MGLRYSSSDSSKLMSALSGNLSTARSTVSELQTGSRQVVAAVDGKTLSGAAYTAGKGLFSELILPTISRVATAIEGVQADLTKYTGANGFIQGEGFLDEDILKRQIRQLKTSQSRITSSARQFKQLASSSSVPGVSNALKSTQRRMEKMATSLQDDIDKLEEKVKKLQNFASQTNGLFSNSLNELKIAMQAVVVLGDTKVNNDGSYSLPAGIDKSWFNQLKGGSSNSEGYGAKEGAKDFLDGLSPKEFAKESIIAALEATENKALKEGKNVGRSWAAKLQPRSSLGTFIKDTNKQRKWLTGKLRGMSNSTSQTIGKFAKWGGKASIGLSAYSDYKEFNNEHQNVGRAVTYSVISTGAGLGAGYVAAGTVGVALASLPATAGIFIAMGVGAATKVGVKALYNNWEPFNYVVNSIGDTLNSAGNKVKEQVGKLGEVFIAPGLPAKTVMN